MVRNNGKQNLVSNVPWHETQEKACFLKSGTQPGFPTAYLCLRVCKECSVVLFQLLQVKYELKFTFFHKARTQETFGTKCT